MAYDPSLPDSGLSELLCLVREVRLQLLDAGILPLQDLEHTAVSLLTLLTLSERQTGD